MSYSSLRRSGMACVNDGSHSFTCHPYTFYPQVEWAILPLFHSRTATLHFVTGTHFLSHGTTMK